MVLQWNTNLQPGMKATALATFLGRIVKILLPNSYQQRMNIQKNLMKRRVEQEKPSRKRVCQNRDEFDVGDPVFIQKGLEKEAWERILDDFQQRQNQEGYMGVEEVW